MSKILNRDELGEYIKQNGITKVRTTAKYKEVPENTVLYFGTDSTGITSYDYKTNSLNRPFNYPFCYKRNFNGNYTGKFEIIESVEGNFKVGDVIRPVGKNNYTITTRSNNYIGEVIKVMEDEVEVKTISCESVRKGTYTVLSKYFELCETRNPEKLNKTMEIDEIKKIDKSVLAEANKEVLEEIDNELKVIAKKKLRELYDKKKLAEQKSDEASSELKDLTKDLKSLTTK